MRSAASKESVRAHMVALMRVGADSYGYGPWHSTYSLADRLGVGMHAVAHNLAALWQEGLVEARRREGSSAQEYRIKPSGAHAPLYPRQDGWSAQALADCLGGFTYYHPADCR